MSIPILTWSSRAGDGNLRVIAAMAPRMEVVTTRSGGQATISVTTTTKAKSLVQASRACRNKRKRQQEQSESRPAKRAAKLTRRTAKGKAGKTASDATSVATETPDSSSESGYENDVNTVMTTVDPDLTPQEIRIARPALKKLLDRKKGGKRQGGRRLKSEPYKLSDSQTLLLADRYLAARNAGIQVTYKKASETKNLTTFTDHPEMLQKHEGEVIRWLQKALNEQRAIDAGKSTKTNEKLEEELSKTLVQTQTKIAKLEAALENNFFESSELQQKLKALRQKIFGSRRRLQTAPRKTMLSRDR